jgi:putative transposase
MIKAEQLDNIRKSCRTIKQADRTIHSWAFYQLKQYSKERAAKFDISVVDIQPAYTSQTCYTCGHVHKKNRTKDKFLCIQCGHRDHADLNAAKKMGQK